MKHFLYFFTGLGLLVSVGLGIAATILFLNVTGAMQYIDIIMIVGIFLLFCYGIYHIGKATIEQFTHKDKTLRE